MESIGEQKLNLHRSFKKNQKSITHLNVDIYKFVDSVDTFEDYLSNSTNKCSHVSIFKRMLEEGIHTDITLKAQGGSIKVHRNVLATVSDVFYAMFSYKMMKEELTSVVEIFDMTIEGLQLFMILLYLEDEEGEIGTHFETAIRYHFDELLQAYEKYQVYKLESIIISALCQILTPTNCWYYLKRMSSKIILHADGDNIWTYFSALKSSKCNLDYFCYTYMVMENYDEVMESNVVRLEMKENPKLVHSIIIARSKYLACIDLKEE